MTSHRRFVHLVEAKHRGAHRVWLQFDDGVSGEVDLGPELVGTVFEPLRDVATFAQFRIDEGQTLSWPNGADFAPEFLRDLIERSVPRARV